MSKENEVNRGRKAERDGENRRQDPLVARAVWRGGCKEAHRAKQRNKDTEDHSKVMEGKRESYWRKSVRRNGGDIGREDER